MADWREYSLEEICRLLAALEQHGGSAFIAGLIARAAVPEDVAHPRVTLRSIVQLLAQTGGRTVLPAAAVAALCSIPEPAPVAEEQAAGIVQKLHPIVVNYSDTFEAMIEAGHYAWVNTNITARNFPPAQKSGSKGVATLLVQYDRPMFSHVAVADLTRRGMRPANMAELLAFGARYPDCHLVGRIVALDAVWVHPQGHRLVANLFSVDSGEGRCLRLDSFDQSWDITCRFLAVRRLG